MRIIYFSILSKSLLDSCKSNQVQCNLRGQFVRQLFEFGKRPQNPEEKERHRIHRERMEKSMNKELVPKGLFENIKEKNKETFMTTLDIFQWQDKRGRGHVEFINSALNYMKQFGVHKDLDTYRKLLDVFPKGKMIATNMLQIEFQHYPKQQQCALDLLDQMDQYSVIPDTEMFNQLANIFGSRSFPCRKVRRMLYWMPKFKYLSPFPLPEPFPHDPFEIAKIAINQITSVDNSTKITVFQTKELADAHDDTWIISAQSEDQMNLINLHPADKPIYVEGAFRSWVGKACVNYFILRSEPKPPPPKPTDDELDDVGDIKDIFNEDFKTNKVIALPTVHEQDDGNILGICATGSSSLDSVVSWIRCLEETNPRLGKDINVLFTLKSPLGPTDDLEIVDEIEENKHKLKQINNDDFRTLGLDARCPDLDQMGISEFSDTRFVNWPHDYNRKSLRAREARKLQMLKEKESPPPSLKINAEESEKT